MNSLFNCVTVPAYNVTIYWVQGTLGDTLQAGKPAVVKCIAHGSYPQPDVTWWLNHQHLTQHSNQVCVLYFPNTPFYV